MKKVVGFEGKPYPDGRFIVPGALTVEKCKIPVANGSDPREILGRASDFKRDPDTGELSFDIELRPDLAPMVASLLGNDKLEPAIFCSPIERDEEGRVTFGVIKAVSLTWRIR